jgi:hypothetical protein
MAKLNIVPPYVVPRHLKLFVDDGMVDAALRRDESWAEYFSVASDRADRDEAKSSTDPRQKSALKLPDEGRIQDAGEALACLRGAGLVVGFHPDSATEPAVDLALELQVPFAVVPCCVFPRSILMGGERRTRAGVKVVGCVRASERASERACERASVRAKRA